MLTYFDVQNSPVQRVAGCNPASSDFADTVNEAIRRLLRRGDWPGTIVPIQTCVRRGCVVWPRYVGEIRKLNWCRRSWSHGGEHVVPVENLWYRFIDPRAYHSEFGCRHPDAFASAGGRVPTYNTIFGDGRLVRAYPSTPEDVGKTLTLFGLDNGNQPLRTNNLDGTWSEGTTITMGSPFGSTAGYVRSLERVRKDVTQGQVFLYAYNAADNTLEDLAVYDPGETNPSYVRQQLSLSSPCCGGCATSHSVIALVKLLFIPVKFPSDLVIIDNLEAIKAIVQSLKLREDYDYQGALAAEADAIRELNRQLEDESPDDQFAAAVHPIGKCTFTNKCF
jgi:hypothetical protein